MSKNYEEARNAEGKKRCNRVSQESLEITTVQLPVILLVNPHQHAVCLVFVGFYSKGTHLK